MSTYAPQRRGCPGRCRGAPRVERRSGLNDVGVGASLGKLDAGQSTEPQGLRCESDAASPQLVDYARPGPHAVGQLDITFEDKSRPIEATETHAAAPSRVLITTVYYPAVDTSLGAARLAAGGPFPSVVYSHGFSFLIDQMLILSKDSQHLLWNAKDEARIGASSVSGGGFTSLLRAGVRAAA